MFRANMTINTTNFFSLALFQVAVTPPRIQNARKVSAVREPTQVVLAPFSAKSIVAFEDIPVTKTAKRYMHIHNPTDDVLKVIFAPSFVVDIFDISMCGCACVCLFIICFVIYWR